MPDEGACIGADTGSGRRDFNGSSAGVVSSGFGANICVNAPGPDDGLEAGGCGVAHWDVENAGVPGDGFGGASSGDVTDWNIRVKSPGPVWPRTDGSGFVCGCGAGEGGEYIGICAVGSNPAPRVELAGGETELNNCVNAPGPDTGPEPGPAAGAGGADAGGAATGVAAMGVVAGGGATGLSGFCAEAVSVCRS